MTGVTVYSRPFFSLTQLVFGFRFLRFSLQSPQELEADLEKLGLTPPAQFTCSRPLVTLGGLPFGEIGAKMM